MRKKIMTAAVSAAMVFSMLCAVPTFAEPSEIYTDTTIRSELGAFLQKSAAEPMLPYQYDELSTQAQKCYIDIRKAVIAHKNSVKISSRISEKTLLTIADILKNQDPLTFSGTEIEYNGISTDNAYARLTYAYTKGVDDSIAKQVAKEADKVIAAFAPDADEYGKFLAIHDHITATAEDDSEDRELSRTAYGPLVLGKGISEGYAYAFQYISITAGLTSVVVSGTDANGSVHTWNKVRIGDSWYNVDCSADDEGGNYDCFMVSDETIKQLYTENGSGDYPASEDYAV